MSPTRRDVLKASAGLVALALVPITTIAGELSTEATEAGGAPTMVGLFIRWGDDADRLGTASIWEVFEGPDGTLRPGTANLMEGRWQ